MELYTSPVKILIIVRLKGTARYRTGATRCSGNAIEIRGYKKTEMKGQIMSERATVRRGGAFTGSAGFPGHSRTMGVHGTGVSQEHKTMILRQIFSGSKNV